MARDQQKVRAGLSLLGAVLSGMLAIGVPQRGLASTSDFPVTVEGDSLALVVRADLGSEILPEFVRERLDRGIPATIGLQVDLWRSRSGWFDNRVGQAIQRYRVSRDAWTGAYLLEDEEGPVGADSLGTLIRRLGEEPVPIFIPRDLALDRAVHWVEVTAVTIPLSVQDLGEVEEWITGEIGGGSSSVFGIPGGILRMVRDLTGLGDRRLAGRSGKFEISLVAGDVIWVQMLGNSP